MQPNRPPEPKEADITRQIRDYLKICGVFHFKVWQGLGSLRGVSDILGILNGRFMAIEVKTRRGRVSEFQQRFLNTVEHHGGIAIVARSVDDVRNIIEPIPQRR